MAATQSHRRKHRGSQQVMDNKAITMATQVLTASNFEDVKFNKALAVQCEGLLQAGRLSWFEEFTWLEYRIALGVLYCKYCARTTSSGSLALGRKPEKTRRIDLIVHAQTDMHINIMHHFQEGKDAHSNLIYISSNSKFCNQKKVHIKSMSIAEYGGAMTNGNQTSVSQSSVSSQEERTVVKTEAGETHNGVENTEKATKNLPRPARANQDTGIGSAQPVALGVIVPQSVHTAYGPSGMNPRISGPSHPFGGSAVPQQILPAMNYSMDSQENIIVLSRSTIGDIAKNSVDRKRIHSILTRHKIKEDWFNEFEWLEMNLSQMKFYCKYCRLRGTNSTLARGKSVAISKSKRNDFIIHAETDSHRNVMDSYKDGSWNPQPTQATVAELLHERRLSVDSSRANENPHQPPSAFNAASLNTIQLQPGLVVERTTSTSPQTSCGRGSVVSGSPQVIVIEPSERENQLRFNDTEDDTALNLTLPSPATSDCCNSLNTSNSITKCSSFGKAEEAERISPNLVQITKVANTSLANNTNERSPNSNIIHNSPNESKRSRSKEQFINLCDSPEQFDNVENDLPEENSLGLVIDSISSNVWHTNSPNGSSETMLSDVHLNRTGSSLSDLCNEMLSDSVDVQGSTPVVSAVFSTAKVSNTPLQSSFSKTTTESSVNDNDGNNNGASSNMADAPITAATNLIGIPDDSKCVNPLPYTSIVTKTPSLQSSCETSPPRKIKHFTKHSKAKLKTGSVFTVKSTELQEQDNHYLPFHDKFWGELNNLRHNKAMCDVTLAVISSTGEMIKYYAHKLILSTASNYFRHLFTTTCENSALLFPNIRPEGLKGLLDYIYGESQSGSAEYYKACYRAAVVLGVNSAKVVFRSLMTDVCAENEVFRVTHGLPSEEPLTDVCDEQRPRRNTCSRESLCGETGVHSSNSTVVARQPGEKVLIHKPRKSVKRKSRENTSVVPDAFHTDCDRRDEVDMEESQVTQLHTLSPVTVASQRKRPRTSGSENDHQLPEDAGDDALQDAHHSPTSAKSIVGYNFSMTMLGAVKEADKCELSEDTCDSQQMANNGGTEVLFHTARLKCYMCRSFVQIPLRYSTMRPKQTDSDCTARRRKLVVTMKNDKRYSYLRCRFCTNRLIHGFMKTSVGNTYKIAN